MRMEWPFRDTGVISVFRYVLAVDLHHRNHTKTKKEKAAISGSLFFLY